VYVSHDVLLSELIATARATPAHVGDHTRPILSIKKFGKPGLPARYTAAVDAASAGETRGTCDVTREDRPMKTIHQPERVQRNAGPERDDAPDVGPRRESIDSVLAKNLMAARLLAGLTQHDLAAASGVSRATIAQLETGVSDPRLSTVVDLAGALGVSPVVLLVGREEVRAIAELPRDLAARPVAVPEHELSRMRLYVRSGLLKDRGRAARVGASVARAAGEHTAGSTLTAGIFSAHLPGSGTAAGAALGRLVE
jgi:transcriptional regulator with XRE-family HTH domain